MSGRSYQDSGGCWDLERHPDFYMTHGITPPGPMPDFALGVSLMPNNWSGQQYVHCGLIVTRWSFMNYWDGGDWHSF